MAAQGRTFAFLPEPPLTILRSFLIPQIGEEPIFSGFMVANLVANISGYAAFGVSRKGSFSYLPLGCRSIAVYLFLFFKMAGMVWITALAIATIAYQIVPALLAGTSPSGVLYVVMLLIPFSLYLWALRLDLWSLREGEQDAPSRSFW